MRQQRLPPCLPPSWSPWQRTVLLPPPFSLEMGAGCHDNGPAPITDKTRAWERSAEVDEGPRLVARRKGEESFLWPFFFSFSVSLSIHHYSVLGRPFIFSLHILFIYLTLLLASPTVYRYLVDHRIESDCAGSYGIIYRVNFY